MVNNSEHLVNLVAVFDLTSVVPGDPCGDDVWTGAAGLG